MRNLWKMQKPLDRAAVACKELKTAQALSCKVPRALTQARKSTNHVTNCTSTIKAL